MLVTGDLLLKLEFTMYAVLLMATGNTAVMGHYCITESCNGESEYEIITDVSMHNQTWWRSVLLSAFCLSLPLFNYATF